MSEIIKNVQRASEGELVVDGIAGEKTWAWIASKVGADHIGASLASRSETEAAADETDSRSEANIATLLPFAQEPARKFLVALNAKLAWLQPGITAKITSGTRTYEEQDLLWLQGRSRPGTIVTNARGGFSNHNFGIAFDITLFISDGSPLWESPLYDAAGALGKQMGLSWGGDWSSIQDKPHFELRPDWARGLDETALITALRARKAIGEAIA